VRRQGTKAERKRTYPQGKTNGPQQDRKKDRKTNVPARGDINWKHKKRSIVMMRKGKNRKRWSEREGR